MTNDTAKPRIAQRFHCARCRDKGVVLEAYYSDFKPTMREIVCPDCGGKRVVPMTRREVIEFVLVFAVIIGLVALGGGQ